MVWPPKEQESWQSKLAGYVIAIFILAALASVVLPFLSPLTCCCVGPLTLLVMAPLLWAGYAYNREDQKRKSREKRRPRMPPEQMI